MRPGAYSPVSFSTAPRYRTRWDMRASGALSQSPPFYCLLSLPHSPISTEKIARVTFCKLTLTFQNCIICWTSLICLYFLGGSMFTKVRAFLLSLTILAVLFFSAVGTTVAYADGGPTPDEPPPPTEEVTPPVQPEAPAKKKKKKTPQPPLLNTIPDNTVVTIIDPRGRPVPLASVKVILPRLK